jgi:hypothetical protein
MLSSRVSTRRRAAQLLVGAGLVLPSSAARGDGLPEPTYGRLEGDLTLVAGLGGVVAPRGPRAEGELRLRYLESAGVFVGYEDGAVLGSVAEPQRVLATGIEVRPLFFFRWFRGHETRRAYFDLVLDSIGLEVGAAFAQPAGDGFASRAGVQAGLGLEFPVAARATGLWIGLHGGVRWGDTALASGSTVDADDRSAFLTITLAWHQVVLAHVVDLGDRAPR